MFRAAILAAGAGARLKAQGLDVPKPLVTIGATPMIGRLAQQISEAGANEIVCILSPEAARLGAEHALRASAPALPVRTVVKSTESSFHSLCELLPLLSGRPFLLSLVDSVCNSRELCAFVSHARSRPDVDACLAVTEFIQDESPLYVRCGTDERIVGFGPPPGVRPTVTGGLYWFGSDVEAKALEARAAGVTRLRNFLAFLLERGAVLEAHRFTRIIDVDTVEDLELARETATEEGDACRVR